MEGQSNGSEVGEVRQVRGQCVALVIDGSSCFYWTGLHRTGPVCA